LDCKRAQSLLDGYVDDELDVATHLDMEQHVQDCPVCGRARRARMQLRQAIGKADLYVKSPARLQSQIEMALRRDAGGNAGAWRRVLAMAACMVLAAGVTLLVVQQTSRSSTRDQLVQEVIGDHVRSLMAGHLADVISTDQHTVKPWFAGKIDFAPSVKDFPAEGFNLAGGRLDYLNGRPVAALVYHRNKHVINLFIWPAESGEKSSAMLNQQGYNIEHWSAGGMNYWLISDLNGKELAELGMLLRKS